MKVALRVLQVYNKYRTWGGEDTVVELEAELLRRNGHEVECLGASTSDLDGAGAWALLAAGLGTVWSVPGYRQARRAIERFSPDILHIHNTFPLLSPSILWAAHRARVPVVHTLHNYRFTCSNAILLREKKPCEECVGRLPLPALRHRCFGGSLPRTAAVTAMNIVHHSIGSYSAKVHAYIALTEFSKEIFVRSGLPRDRIFVKPNFYIRTQQPSCPRTANLVFAGAIVDYKGIHLLLDAWSRLSPQGHELFIVGDGPDRERLQRQYACVPNVIWCGRLPRDKVIDLIAKSKWLVLPSLAYENFPTAILEAFSMGTPVIVPDRGAFPSIVSGGREGLSFSAGNTSSLTEVLEVAIRLDAVTWTEWSNNVRAKFLNKYTDAMNYEQLLAIYKRAAEFEYASRSRARKRSATKELSSASELQ